MSRIAISLTEVNGESVSLNSMSTDALESFMAVISSLKALVTNIVSKEELVFSIIEGSAQCVVEAPDSSMSEIYNEMDLALKGGSEDKEVTTYLRNIQQQIKRNNYNYKFIYTTIDQPTINLHSRLIDSPRISIKRKRNKYDYKLIVKGGFLNQIGGKAPNYHFDFGGGEKMTISCTFEDAKQIKQYLYQDVESLVLCKEWNKEDKPSEYTHKAIVDNTLGKHLRRYLSNYNKESNLVSKLTLTHDFIDMMFKDGLGHKALNTLLIGFNDEHFHLSELKTLLVISKSFEHIDGISKARISLSERYQEIKNKL